MVITQMMYKFNYFTVIYALMCTVLCFLQNPLFSRDINLDEIYLSPKSPFITKLLLEKLDAYFTVGSHLIDRHVSFSGWISDTKIGYIKEIPQTKTNVIMIYDTQTKISREFTRIEGDVMYAVIFPGGKFMGMKIFILGKNIIPEPFIGIISLSDGQKKLFPSSNPLLDFTVSPDGTSIIKLSKHGIVSFDLFSETERVIFEKSNLPINPENETTLLAYPSSDKSKWALLAGGGGAYRLWITEGKNFKEIQNTTSSTEIAWITTADLLFRTGGAGNFVGIVYNAISGKYKQLTDASFNTSLRYFPSSRTVTWLKDGLIHLHKIDQNTSISTGLEGDDVALDSVGSRFISTINNRLFLTDVHILRKKNIELLRIHRNIFTLYQEAYKNKLHHQNEFSAMYLKRKVLLYEEFIKAKK